MTVNNREQIIFGEIKTGRKGWAAAGKDQIIHTIDIFRANHNLAEWGQCRAYVSNHRYWYARQSTRSIQESFKTETGGLCLYIQKDVHIDGEFQQDIVFAIDGIR